GVGCPIIVLDRGIAVRPNRGWLDRTVNGLGGPIDGGAPLPSGPLAYPLRASPPPAYFRRRVGEKLDVGVRAMNTLLNLCRGQRMGLFAGSRVAQTTPLRVAGRVRTGPA